MAPRGEQTPKAVARRSKIAEPMSALGQKQTLGYVRVMSALLPKADIAESDPHVILPRESAANSRTVLARLESLIIEKPPGVVAL
jgi:hypothetical protein